MNTRSRTATPRKRVANAKRRAKSKRGKGTARYRVPHMPTAGRWFARNLIFRLCSIAFDGMSPAAVSVGPLRKGALWFEFQDNMRAECMHFAEPHGAPISKEYGANIGRDHALALLCAWCSTLAAYFWRQTLAGLPLHARECEFLCVWSSIQAAAAEESPTLDALRAAIVKRRAEFDAAILFITGCDE